MVTWISTWVLEMPRVVILLTSIQPRDTAICMSAIHSLLLRLVNFPLKSYDILKMKKKNLFKEKTLSFYVFW